MDHMVTPTFYSVFLNNTDTQQVFLMLQDEHTDLYLSAEDLTGLRFDLKGFQGETVVFKNKPYFRLRYFMVGQYLMRILILNMRLRKINCIA